MRPFVLQRRGRTFRSVPAAGSALPACIFATILRPNCGPFGFRIPVPVSPFDGAPRNDRHPQPVAKSSLKSSRLYPSRRSPPGPLDPSGSKRSTRIQPGTLTLTSRPIFLRSPPRENILYRRETDRRSESATSRQAHCSSNLLEPSSSCADPGSGARPKTRFQQEI